jgi:hypothetical protein
MTVTLTNTSGRMQVFNLPHESYCAALGRCACRSPEAPRPAPLTVRELPGQPVRARRPACASLTLAAGKGAAGLPDAVLAAPDVARAVRTGLVAVRRDHT